MPTSHDPQTQGSRRSRRLLPLFLTLPGQKQPAFRKYILFVFLFLLAIFVILGGMFKMQLFNSAHTQTNLHLSPAGSLDYKQIATLDISHMTLDEELGQLFMVAYNSSSYSADLDAMVVQQHAGGVILYQTQIKTFDQTKHDIARMQTRASIPLLIATDEEGGFVDRLANISPPRPSALSIYRTGSPAVAAQMGDQTAQDLRSLGINENLAPDSDVLLANGPDQYARTFGYTPQSVITFAGAYMRAMQHDGIIACIKHFPGLGAASTDAHVGLPVVRRTKAQLYAVELAPFKAFIQAPQPFDRPGMVMTTDVLMPAIDSHLPAELSPTFVTDILRKQFGYNGVVITDSLSMQGISKSWDMPQAAVMSLLAGNDMLLGVLGSNQMVRTIAGLKLALQHSVLTKIQIDNAVTHILVLKMQYHLLPTLSLTSTGIHTS